MQKYFASPFGRNSIIDSRHPAPTRGAFAIVTDAERGMRWTPMVLKTNGA
jgi:hypothetical protein